MWRALNRVHALGYRRPGLVIGRYEDTRSAHAYVSAYLGWLQITFGTPAAIPLLQIDQVEDEPILSWLRQQRPDVVIFVHQHHQIALFETFLKRSRIRVPEELGIAVISQSLDGTIFSGLQENQRLIGAWAIELLAARVANGDFGIPANPRIEMVERQWIEGRSLRE